MSAMFLMFSALLHCCVWAYSRFSPVYILCQREVLTKGSDGDDLCVGACMTLAKSVMKMNQCCSEKTKFSSK